MSDRMTLAFEVEALAALADPESVFEDARRWSAHVGVISDRMAYQVVNYLREQGVYNEDFFSRADKGRSLEHVRARTDADRYVFVGHTTDDEELAEETGWEYLSIEEAARKAEWELERHPLEQ